MFEDWPKGSLAHAGQQLGMAVLRFRVSVIDKAFRPVVRWLIAKLDGKTATK
jgi:hypothetical protein